MSLSSQSFALHLNFLRDFILIIVCKVDIERFPHIYENFHHRLMKVSNYYITLSSVIFCLTRAFVTPSGWQLLLKGVGGAPGDLLTTWKGPGTVNAKNPIARQLDNQLKENYKPSLPNYWDKCKFELVSFTNYLRKETKNFDKVKLGSKTKLRPNRKFL